MLLLAVALWLSSSGMAHAYLDPGTGSILLQAVIGGVASGLFIMRIYWRKIRSFLGRAGDEEAQGKARHGK